MYTPSAFREEDTKVLHDLIDEFGFATLVTLGSEGLTANHIPLAIDRKNGPKGRLRGHLAKGNPQLKDMQLGRPALAIFQGPNTYISPNLYPSKKEHGKVVPTWNFVAVHASGPLTVLEDVKALMDIVGDLTNKHEQASKQPWKISDAPEDYIQHQLKGITGFEIQIKKLEGKWKMGQNKSNTDRQGTIDGLSESKDSNDLDVAAIMRDVLSD
jgi:transcriptional regulator